PAPELEVEARVLGYGGEAGAVADRSLLGVVEGLLEGDVAVARSVGGAQEAGHEVVREEGAAEALGLVRVLQAGARGDERRTLRGDVEQIGWIERRADDEALGLRPAPAMAGVEHTHPDPGADLLDAVANGHQ